MSKNLCGSLGLSTLFLTSLPFTLLRARFAGRCALGRITLGTLLNLGLEFSGLYGALMYTTTPT